MWSADTIARAFVLGETMHGPKFEHFVDESESTAVVGSFGWR